MPETTPIHLSDEQYRILHRMISEQLEAALGPFDDVEGFEPTEEQYAMLSAVTHFSSQSPVPLTSEAMNPPQNAVESTSDKKWWVNEVGDLMWQPESPGPEWQLDMEWNDDLGTADAAPTDALTVQYDIAAESIWIGLAHIVEELPVDGSDMILSAKFAGHAPNGCGILEVLFGNLDIARGFTAVYLGCPDADDDEVSVYLGIIDYDALEAA